MKPTILVTGASGGTQGATGNHVTRFLREKGIPVRAFVHNIDERSLPLREMEAEIFAGRAKVVKILLFKLVSGNL